jgi:hypothetical protein
MNQKKKKDRIAPAEKKAALMEASKFILDLAKLVFAGIILGSIMDMGISKGGLLLVGGLIVCVFIFLGAYSYYYAIKKF